jgi:hypothetical protein
VNDIASQLRSEWIHIAFIAVYAGISYFVARSIRLGDERAKAVADQVRENVTELASHARQIRDTRAAVACCETELKIQHYPYTD